MAGAAFFVAPADAASKAKTTGLALSTSDTSFTTLNLGTKVSGGALAQNLASATYALHVSSTLSSTASTLGLVLDSYTAPSGIASATASALTPSLFAAEANTGGSAGPATGWGSAITAVGTDSAVSKSLTVASQVATKDVFLTAANPGTYKFHFVDTGATAGTSDDIDSATITMTVLDAYNTTDSATSGNANDDWAPTVAVSSSNVKLGAPLTATVPLTAVSVTDARGASSGVGTLASKLGALVGFDFDSDQNAVDTALSGYYFDPTSTTATDQIYSSANNSVSASAVSVTIPANLVTTANTLTTLAAFDKAGLGTWLYGASAAVRPAAFTGTPTTVYATSGVTAWHWGPVESTGTVNAITTSTVKVKTGLASTTFQATVDTLASVSYSKEGQTVYFTIAPGNTADSVSATGGSLLSSNTSTGVKVYSATTNSDGVASITVVPSATAASKTFTVKSNLNGVAATASAGTTLVSSGNTVVTFEDPAPSTIVNTSGAENLYPSVSASSITLSGKLTDQFGANSQPGSASPQQATVTVAGTAHYVPVVNGQFSYTYTPSTTPTGGSTTTAALDYGALSQVAFTVHWVATTPAGTVTVTSPANGASAIAIEDHAVPSGSAVSGYVTDAGGAAIAYKLVTLSGSDGVYFANDAAGATGMSKTLTVGADASGLYSAYAFYTKTGSVTVTAKADSKTATSTFSTADSADMYKVIVKDAFVTPGNTVTISGAVKDAFGNPVPLAYVDLSLGSTGLGTLASTNPQTNSGGVFSTTFSTADNSSVGTATITAKLRSTINVSGSAIMTANPTANSGWATAGVTVPDGAYMDQGTLEVGKAKATTLSAPAYRAGAGKVVLHGEAVPGVVVEIYAKPAGSSAPFGWIDSVMSDESSGEWTAEETISGSTTFIAKTSTSTSSAATTAVKSSVGVSVSAKATGKGMVKVSVNGKPDKQGSIAIYVDGKKVKSMTSSAAGDGSASIKAGKGKRTIKVVFTYGGSSASATTTVTVK